MSDANAGLAGDTTQTADWSPIQSGRQVSKKIFDLMVDAYERGGKSTEKLHDLYHERNDKLSKLLDLLKKDQWVRGEHEESGLPMQVLQYGKATIVMQATKPPDDVLDELGLKNAKHPVMVEVHFDADEVKDYEQYVLLAGELVAAWPLQKVLSALVKAFYGKIEKIFIDAGAAEGANAARILAEREAVDGVSVELKLERKIMKKLKGGGEFLGETLLFLAAAWAIAQIVKLIKVTYSHTLTVYNITGAMLKLDIVYLDNVKEPKSKEAENIHDMKLPPKYVYPKFRPTEISIPTAELHFTNKRSWFEGFDYLLQITNDDDPPANEDIAFTMAGITVPWGKDNKISLGIEPRKVNNPADYFKKNVKGSLRKEAQSGGFKGVLTMSALRGEHHNYFSDLFLVEKEQLDKLKPKPASM